MRIACCDPVSCFAACCFVHQCLAHLLFSLPFCTAGAMLGPFNASCDVAPLLETAIHIAEDHMHLQVSTSLIDHLFGSFTTTCCLSACCGFASPRACEEARLLLLPIKECRIQKPADAGAVRDTLPEMLDRWAHGTENNETCGKCGR